jgi:hypothetical protein
MTEENIKTQCKTTNNTAPNTKNNKNKPQILSPMTGALSVLSYSPSPQ